VFGLPNIKSAKKRVLISEERNARNKAAKSELKTAIKKFEVAAADGNRTEADGAYKVAVKKVDQAVVKGVLPAPPATAPPGRPTACASRPGATRRRSPPWARPAGMSA
jgi:small subunit ribosomal protein S20